MQLTAGTDSVESYCIKKPLITCEAWFHTREPIHSMQKQVKKLAS